VSGYSTIAGDADAGRALRLRAAMPADGEIADLADVFGLLADPGRLRLLAALRHGELRAGELAAVAGMSESAASHALRILRAHRVVAVRRSGRMAFYVLADGHVRTLLDVALAHMEHSSLVHDHGDDDD
jgi:DNA-binding transcriptional ArsR family regulator